jgi:hypothetical protein
MNLRIDKIDQKSFFNAMLFSFLYVLIGTYDNLTGLQLEKFINSIICGAGSSGCELIMLLLYSQSYLYGALFCAFLGSSDIAFIFCQIIVFLFFTAILYIILREIRSLKERKKEKSY